jgi:hypothetical protein
MSLANYIRHILSLTAGNPNAQPSQATVSNNQPQKQEATPKQTNNNGNNNNSNNIAQEPRTSSKWGLSEEVFFFFDFGEPESVSDYNYRCIDEIFTSSISQLNVLMHLFYYFFSYTLQSRDLSKLCPAGGIVIVTRQTTTTMRDSVMLVTCSTSNILTTPQTVNNSPRSAQWALNPSRDHMTKTIGKETIAMSNI